MRCLALAGPGSLTLAVASHEAVSPVVAVLVELDGVADGRILLRQLEEAGLHGGAVAVALACGLDDGAGVDALVDMEGYGGHLEGGVFCLASPLQLGVEVGVVGVSPATCVLIGLRRDHTHGRVVQPLLVAVVIVLDRTFGLIASP